MQGTQVTGNKPLIAQDNFAKKAKTIRETVVTENEILITKDDFAANEQRLLMHNLLIMVIVVNLIVLISIFLCA